MATTISTLQNDLYASPLDVRLLNELIQSTTQNSKILADTNRIIFAIYLASGEVNSALKHMYSEANFETTPYALPPITPKYNEYSSITENTGSGVLYGIQPSADAKCEQLTITFSDATNYTVVGSRSGSQGSGVKGVAFTTTNGWVTIPADVFSGTPASGDIFYVSVCHVYTTIMCITALKAASWLHFSLFSSAAPNEDSLAKVYQNEANRMLKNLSNGFDESGQPYRLDSFSSNDLSEISSPWFISGRSGSDLSNYVDDSPERVSSDIQSSELPWYW